MSLDWLRVLGLHWYDRNPKSKADEFDESVGGHSGTDRLSYVCPVAKIAMVEVLSVNAARTTAASTVGWVNVRWFFIPKGKSRKRIFTMNFHNNTPGDLGAKIERTVGSTLMMFEGDELILRTGDASDGGAVSYECGYKITEFDAFPIERPKPDIQEMPPRDPRM